MESAHFFMIVFTFLGILAAYQFKAQSPAQPPSASASGDARALDALLQDYAYRAFNRPRTGVPYEGKVPFNISGIRIFVVRLRSGSLRSKGVTSFQEFEIPPGVIERPYVKRLSLVYQNLGDRSSIYYQVPGHTFITPVLGLLAYEASNLSATNLRELEIEASMNNISVKFRGVSPLPSGSIPKCVWFDLDGTSQLNFPEANNVCTTKRQGHFAIVVNSTTMLAPPPTPSQGLPTRTKKKNSKVWKIVVSVVGGFLALVLLALLVVWIKRCRQNRKMKEMVQRAESGEVLQKHRIGNAQLPVASMIRTRPTLENELAP